MTKSIPFKNSPRARVHTNVILCIVENVAMVMVVGGPNEISNHR